jgi:putative transferase (TIGR04331 family)
LERAGRVPYVLKNFQNRVGAPKSSKLNIKQTIFGIYSKVTSIFVRDRDVFLIGTYLASLRNIRLYLRFFQIPQWRKSLEPVRAPVELQQRKWEMADQSRSEFEKFVLAMIPKQIPTLYLEGYRLLGEQTRRLPWPRRPKLIYTANVLFHDTVSMAYTAEKVEQGSPLVYGQHGGFYGMAWFIWAEEHERKIADKYLTWGWTAEGGTETIPVGITKKINYRKTSTSNSATDLLLVLRTLPRYAFRLDSDVGANQTLKNINDCLRFADFVSESDAYRALLVRPHNEGYGWGVKDRWIDAHPRVRLDDGITPIWDLVKGSRLVVYTYNSTGYLEFFAADVPTIIFWDVSSMPVRDAAIPYFEELKRVGIFHETPESAAAHVKMIWNNVDAWWANAGVQEVLARFKKQYCYCPNNLLDRMEIALRDVISESETKQTSVDTII